MTKEFIMMLLSTVIVGNQFYKISVVNIYVSVCFLAFIFSKYFNKYVSR